MKNFSTIPDCIQAFLSKDEINSILDEIEYKDSARKFDVSNLLNHWIVSSLDGWKSFRDSEVRSKSHNQMCVKTLQRNLETTKATLLKGIR